MPKGPLVARMPYWSAAIELSIFELDIRNVTQHIHNQARSTQRICLYANLDYFDIHVEKWQSPAT